MSKQPSLTPEVLVPRLGESLVNAGLLTEVQLAKALDYQNQQKVAGESVLLGQVIIELGFLDRATLDHAVTEQIIMLRAALEDANRNLENRVRQRTAELQEALEKLSELNHMKANFISNVSHELRTPLTHIKGYLELLVADGLGPLNDDQRKALVVAQRSANRLQTLIDDLIQFAMATRGELTLQKRSVDLSAMASNALNHSRSKADDHEVGLLSDIEDGLPYVQADEEKLTWALSHLLDNAIKFTSAGGQVRLSIHRDEHNPRMVRIAVSDTGIGIPGDRLGEVFEPFHQLDASATRRFGGTGLGLALVKDIIEAHGSIIEVHSIINEGTTFSFPMLLSER
jgi:signal transduction histidine kinase